MRQCLRNIDHCKDEAVGMSAFHTLTPTLSLRERGPVGCAMK